ncbi:hypothetical protein [Phenylobacterium sp.]|uniref:hypothetical protein n=1 Tax=Phenylobacterium sp. TaxID=1871053 RepID=UPI002FE3C371
MAVSLDSVVKKELGARTPPAIRRFAEALAQAPGAIAVLFYGSTLRTGDLTGLLDFYVLTDQPHRTGLRRLAERALWPEVSYREVDADVGVLRAKVATMPLATFARAAGGETLDTTIWARFVQPTALVWTRDVNVRDEVVRAVTAAVRTAGRFAAALGPERGVALEFWRALFRQTYQAEFRVETAGRADELLRAAPARWTTLLPLAWSSEGLAFQRVGDDLRPALDPALRRHLQDRWRMRRLAGKPLNMARLVKAAFTFDGAARYAAWKIERHTGLQIAVTPFRERHPILAAPGVLWRLWRAKRA